MINELDSPTLGALSLSLSLWVSQALSPLPQRAAPPTPRSVECLPFSNKPFCLCLCLCRACEFFPLHSQGPSLPPAGPGESALWGHRGGEGTAGLEARQGPPSSSLLAVHRPQGTPASQVPTGALECAVGNSCHLVPGSRWHLSARLPPRSLDARAGLTRKRRRGWEHDADREAASAAVTQGVFLPLSGPVSGLGQDGTSPAHGLREDPGDRAGLRCRPQQRGNVRAQRASRWGPAGVRSAWRPGDSALRRPRAQLHTPGGSVTRPARPQERRAWRSMEGA